MCTPDSSALTLLQTCSGCSVQARSYPGKLILHSVMELLRIDFALPTLQTLFEKQRQYKVSDPGSKSRQEHVAYMQEWKHMVTSFKLLSDRVWIYNKNIFVEGDKGGGK